VRDYNGANDPLAKLKSKIGRKSIAVLWGSLKTHKVEEALAVLLLELLLEGPS
jgi:hypothetical protein